MLAMLGDLFTFLGSVYSQWASLASGSFGLAILFYERLSLRELPVRILWRVLGWVCLLFAIFFVWQEKYTRVTQLERELRQEQQKNHTLEHQLDNTSTQVTQLQRELIQLQHKQSVVFAITDVQPNQYDGSTVMMNFNVIAFNLGTSDILIISIRAQVWIDIHAPDSSGKIIRGGQRVSNRIEHMILKSKGSQDFRLNLKLNLKKYVDTPSATMLVREAPQERCLVVDFHAHAIVPDTTPKAAVLVYPFKIIRVNPDATLGGGYGSTLTPDMFEAPHDQYAHTSFVLHKCEVDQPYTTPAQISQ